jgi:pimeloyl-ACP methyl ester carboxylesterase
MSDPNATQPTPPDPSRRQPAPGALPEQPKPAARQPAAAPTPRPAAPTPARSAPRATRGRVPTIHYELSYLVQHPERGPRGAIVLLHDLPGGAFVWQGVLPALAETGRAVYAFDMLGYGESDHPWPADCSVWGHADNLAPALRALGLSEIVLVGFGVGGGAAQVLVNRMCREGVAALALINTYAYDYAYAPGWPMTEMEQRHDPDAPRHTTTEQMLADLRATLATGAANPRYLAGSALDAYLGEWNSDLGRECFFQHVRQMRPDYILSVASDNKTLQIPTLIVWGEHDQVTPLTLGKRLARDIPGARLQVVPNAAHLILDDAADRVGAALAEFIGGLRRVERASGH